MWAKLKRLWLYNRREIKAGLGSGLGIIGVLLLINSFPHWLLKTAIGAAALSLGIKLLKSL